MGAIEKHFIHNAADSYVELANYQSFAHDVVHFSSWEVKEPKRMNLSFMARMDFYRHVAGVRIFVCAAWADRGHSHKQSKHYTGEAIDGYLEGWGLLEMFRLAVLCNFKGIGIYPWGGRYNSRAFIHLDNRETEDGRIATWMRNENFEYVKLLDEYKSLLVL